MVSATDIDAGGNYYYGRLKDIDSLDDPAAVPIAWDKEAWHGGGNVSVLWADFSVRKIPASELSAKVIERNALYESEPVLPK